MIIFLLVAAPIENNSIAMTYLGADGLFIAIILSLLTVEITMFIEKLDWKFKGEHIPPAVLSFMNGLILLLVNIIIIYGLSITIFIYIGKDIPSLIMMILIPALIIGNNIWSYVAIVVFGTPIILNPILAIPFLFMPIVSLSLTYVAQKIDLISMGYIVDPSFAPFFIQGYLSSMDIRNLIFTIFIAVLSIIIYYPFFKIHEKHMLEIENSI